MTIQEERSIDLNVFYIVNGYSENPLLCIIDSIIQEKENSKLKVSFKNYFNGDIILQEINSFDELKDLLLVEYLGNGTTAIDKEDFPLLWEHIKNHLLLTYYDEEINYLMKKREEVLESLSLSNHGRK